MQVGHGPVQTLRTARAQRAKCPHCKEVQITDWHEAVGLSFNALEVPALLPCSSCPGTHHAYHTTCPTHPGAFWVIVFVHVSPAPVSRRGVERLQCTLESSIVVAVARRSCVETRDRTLSFLQFSKNGVKRLKMRFGDYMYCCSWYNWGAIPRRACAMGMRTRCYL